MTPLTSQNVPQPVVTVLRDIGVGRSLSAGTTSATFTPQALTPRSGGPVASGSRRRGSGTEWASLRATHPSALPNGSAPVSEVQVNVVDDSVTGLIRAWSTGDEIAGDRLFSRVYDELRLIARRLHRRSAPNADDTLGTTALVHEVYLRLAGATELNVQNRAHFFAVAVRASRQIISNYARDAQALKRGGDVILEPLQTVAATDLALGHASDTLDDRVVALESALVALEQLHPRPCRVVECRYFTGLSIPETAVALSISEATVKRDWAVAQAWLHRALREPGDTNER
jgi:RNA polymerase sigma factor (TIGR02999 family)